MKNYQDYYFLKAKRENYPARSIYKLKEIDKRFKVFRKGQHVLDLGAAPGSWTLGAAEQIGENGVILAADLKGTETPFPSQVTFVQADVFNRSEAFETLLLSHGPFDVVLSDMAPNTTGHRGTDQARSAALCEEALAVACGCLVRGGSFVVKMFMGPDSKSYSDSLRKYFATARSFKPQSTRSESKEFFYIARNFKGCDKNID